MTPIADVVRRCFDFVGALAGLIVLSPVMVLVGALIRLRMGPPVLFRQARPGLHARPFVLYKFRTMRKLRAGEMAQDETEQERLTRLGAKLRRWSLDEMPQLWNVLKGEMAFVGPRPLLMHYCALYSPEQARRHEVRPGITGWAQIHGRNETTWDERLAMDTWYVDHRSLALDLRILAETVLLVVRRKGTVAEGYATMPQFRGSEKGKNGS